MKTYKCLNAFCIQKCEVTLTDPSSTPSYCPYGEPAK